MVITCPSCAARYRLNPDKVQGRGAKITCPKCAHVFVVFTDKNGEPATRKSTSSRPAAAPGPPAPVPSEAEKRSATQTGAFRAVGVEETGSRISTTSKNQVRVVAPGPRSTRRMRVLSTPNSAAPQAPASLPETPAVEAAEVSSARELDFRSVGIKTWKVKVAIGLIYDFSDIATLQKYLADKKVTPDDLISHNNADWTRIGDIEDLEKHFIETWKSAKAAIDSGEAPKPAPKKKVTSPGGAAPVGSSTDSFRIDTGRGGRTTGNYPTPAPPRRRKEPEPEPESRRTTLMILAAVVLVGSGLVVALLLGDAPVAQAPAPPRAVAELGPSDEELERIQQGIRDKLEEERAKVSTELDEVEAGVLAEGEDAPERQLVAVRPDERQASEPVSPAAEQTKQKYIPPVKPTPVAGGNVATSRSSKPSTVKETKGDPARMYLEAGRKKLATGDYGSARKMFLAAISKNKSCSECYSGLAEAERQLGNSDGADEATKKARELGNTQSLARP